jgi:repressor of nif and glnA expression
MNKLEGYGFKALVFDLLKETVTNEIRASFQKISNVLNKRGYDCDKFMVRRAIEKLESEGKIARKSDNRGTYITLLYDFSNFKKTHAIKQCPTIVYEIYNRMKYNHVGKANAISMEELSRQFNISERKTRGIVRKINNRGYTLKNGATFKRKIIGDVNGYYMVETIGEAKHYMHIKKIKMQSAIDEFKIGAEDLNLDNQMKFPISDFEGTIVKSISDDLKNNKENLDKKIEWDD